MYLLQALNSPWFHAVKQATFNKRVSFFLALPINAVVAIGKPVEESIGTIVGIMLSYRLHTRCIQRICKSLFAIRSLEFEVVSDTNQLNAI